MNKKENKNKNHPRVSLSGVYNACCSRVLLNKQPSVEDPRQQHSGMVPLFNNGFTLIELLVVVLIIGILAAIALPQYQKAVDLARVKGTFPVLRAIKNAEISYRLANGQYTKDFSELDIDLSIKKYVNNSTNLVLLTDGNYYKLDDDGSYWHVFVYPMGISNMAIYLAFARDAYLCYPEGTQRGKNVCKALGCDNVNTMNCAFNP